MKKLLFASLLLTSACDVDSRETDTTRVQAVCNGDDTMFCGAAMPAKVKWDGKPLPQTQGEAAVIIMPHPQDAALSLLVEMDGDQIVAYLEFATRDTGKLIDVLITDGNSNTSVYKQPRPTPPREFDGTYYHAIVSYEREARKAAEAAEVACSGLPTGK